jgi:GDPmannose 4,6-dehydratase
VKKAVILGINGQDGSYLAEFLLAKDYKVVGWIPVRIPVSLDNINQILDQITLIEGDLFDQNSLNACIEEYHPDEIYNLASPSSPSASWHDIVQIGEVVALGVARLLEAIRLVHPKVRFFQASSSELFGDPAESPQRETTPFHPRNPYGMAKLYAHWAVVNYRQQYGLFAVSGIMFNHESPRRPIEFISRKITYSAAAIKAGKLKELYLGNLDACRDWGYAPDYVEAMWKMLQGDRPGDYVIGTGESHSVRGFLEEAFSYLNMDWHEFVKTDPHLFRPTEANILRADPARAEQILGWQPRVFIKDLVRIMVDADLDMRGLKSPGEGARILERHFRNWYHGDNKVISPRAN